MSRKLLVLDIDGTMVNCDDRPPSDQRPWYDTTFDLPKRGGSERFYVQIRPGLPDFLIEAAKDYDLAVWTASSYEYAEAMLKAITPEGITYKKVFGGDRCIRKYNSWDYTTTTIKPLRKIWKGYGRTKTLIVDDTRATYCQNHGNAIAIRTYTGAKDDELQKILTILKQRKDALDVRLIR